MADARWRPIETLDPKQAMHINVRTSDGKVISWRYLPYKPDARRQGYPHGRWQIATEHGFTNAELPKQGDWIRPPHAD